MRSIHLEVNDPTCEVMRKAFPAYRGRSYKIQVYDAPGMNTSSYWSGGSRDIHRVIRLEDNAMFQIPENGSGFSQVDHVYGPSGIPVKLPSPGFAVVTHSIFCGKDAGLTLSVHADNAARLLPSPKEITQDQKIVLVYTRSYKPSYNGISNYRYHEAHIDLGISAESWERAKQECIAAGFLDSRGAITVSGRNVVSNIERWALR